MDNINFHRFYFKIFSRIIALVDAGHHLNTLENINIACALKITSFTYLAKSRREKVLINLPTSTLFIIRSNLGKHYEKY